MAVIAVAALGLVYVAFFADDSPDRLALTGQPATGAATGGATVAPSEIAGTWRTAAGSEAGYRVREKLASLPAKSDAVGRTQAVTGTVRVDRSGDSLVAGSATVKVDLTKLASGESRRDNRIRTDGLQTNTYPEATFVGTESITLPPEAATGQPVKVQAKGDLTIRGVTRRVTIPLDVRLTGGRGELVGCLSSP